ncbi:MAG: succinyl-diaminopimelate desuccinylase [Pseudomonadales bacterium]|nr:succinyl-diaminopimelate desuccinylase [Pseudomonadales bacterium]MDG1442128.1 succinyl-diaminopimelate desuccinylase [Pseudomonadales bacterium]
MTDSTLELTKKLVSARSISPADAGCQSLIAEHLTQLGFEVEAMPFADVSNLWATHGEGAPYFTFAGHTDVVPSGSLEDWSTDPFEPTVIDGQLYGRGAADMKGSIAAMLTATKNFLSEHPDHKGTLAFLITSDEEADAINGTRRVVETLAERGIQLDWCLIGEPSSDQVLGDVVRTGRRGSLHAKIVFKGVQGHVAYPDDAKNPIHAALPALTDLTHEVWDAGNEFFPPTSMQISNLHGGTGVTNVIPGSMELLLNFRFSTELNEPMIKARTETILDKHDIEYEILWTLSGVPFLTVGGELIPAVEASLSANLNIKTLLSTSGGTSDGRFIAPTGTQVVELGPRNATIHKVNECVDIDDLDKLAIVYQDIVARLL